MWSHLMGNNSLHHLLAVWLPLIAYRVHFCIFSNFGYFGKFSYQSCAKWVHIQWVSSLVNGKRFIVSFINRTAQHMFMLISTHFHWFCDIHLWNGFDWFNQSWLWHWCMPSLHLEWYYATNDSGVHFCFCNSVVQWRIGLLWKCWGLLSFFWELLNFKILYDACGFLLNGYWTEVKKCTIWAINFKSVTML